MEGWGLHCLSGRWIPCATADASIFVPRRAKLCRSGKPEDQEADRIMSNCVIALLISDASVGISRL